MSSQSEIISLVARYHQRDGYQCNFVSQVREPLITIPLPSFPWQRLVVDLFEMDKTPYLIAVDYFQGTRK